MRFLVMVLALTGCSQTSGDGFLEGTCEELGATEDWGFVELDVPQSVAESTCLTTQRCWAGAEPACSTDAWMRAEDGTLHVECPFEAEDPHVAEIEYSWFPCEDGEGE